MAEEKENKEKKKLKAEREINENIKKKNPWLISTVVLGSIVVVILFFVFKGGVIGGITGTVISEGEAGNKLVDYLNTRTGGGVSLVSAESEDSLYKVTVSYQGDKIPLYITKDGKYFIQSQSLMPLTGQVVNPQQPTTTGYSEEDLANIKEFSNCLAEKGLKVYGAGWCGHCQNLIDYFGGEEAISPIFIECSDAQRNPTENAGLCEKEGITGYPTIKINGEPYTGARTFEAFAEATGCPVPDISI